MIGGGQLGRMFALEAKRMGYRLAVLEPAADSPCGQIADIVLERPYEDKQALSELASLSDAITYEFENIAADAVRYLEGLGKPVRPGSRALEITQDRWLEKSFIRDLELPVTPFGLATTASDLATTLRSARLPGFLKTSRGGYDGKGQIGVSTPDQAESARQSFQGAGLIYEEAVDFSREFSLVAVRNPEGQSAAFPVLENQHRHHILHRTFIPGRIPPEAARQAESIALAIGRGLDFQGTYCVEFFLTRDERVLVNEIAPRPHNSGHFSLDACSHSQFEMQVRALCGLPLVTPRLLQPAVMLNLVGDRQGGRLDGIADILRVPGVHLHLYGKSQVAKGRKMGHVTVMADSLEEAIRLTDGVEDALSWG